MAHCCDILSIMHELKVISSALEVTMKKRDRNSFVVLNLLHTVGLQAGSNKSVCWHLFLCPGNHNILHILTKIFIAECQEQLVHF